MRYGSFAYGDGTKYGESPHDTQLWAVVVDWDGDGKYDYANEAINVTNLKITRGRNYLLASDGNGFEPISSGSLTLEMDNADGRYNPFNTSSPIYPYVRPGVKIAVMTRLPGSGETYPVFTGQIDDLAPISGSYERVKIVAQDGLERLGQEIVLPIQANIRLEEAIRAVLNAAAWPWEVELESSPDIIPWFWAPSGIVSRDLIHDVADAHLGLFFVAADGTAVFYTRNHDQSSAKLRIEQGQLAGEVMTRSPWEVIRNQIAVTCHPRAAQATEVVWELYDKPAIAPGETYETWGVFSANGEEAPISGYQTPVSGTDYQVNSAADGSGTDLSGSCTVVAIVYANQVHFLVTNNSGISGNIILLRLRANPLISSSAKTVLSDPASQTFYGPKSLTINSLFLQNSNLIADIAHALSLLLTDPQIYPTVTITCRPEIQYALDLFDNVDLVIDKMGIQKTYRLASIEHQWLGENGQDSTSVFGFEPISPNPLDVVWTFPAQIGIDTIFSF